MDILDPTVKPRSMLGRDTQSLKRQVQRSQFVLSRRYQVPAAEEILARQWRRLLGNKEPDAGVNEMNVENSVFLPPMP